MKLTIDLEIEEDGRWIAEALVAASKGADLLVVGNRGRSPFLGAVLGAVSLRCATAAACPVTIVKLLKYPATRIYDSSVYNYTFGYGEESDDGSGDGCDESSTYSTRPVTSYAPVAVRSA